ncbi:MAG: phytanoyl-CoA dioxygenase family protein [Chitinophagales bacterium]|nr:phytanoyl-CoA dioxygenase family protein [Chitinophagales bacterium]
MKNIELKKFSLGYSLTQEQIDYYNTYGFIHFESFLSEQEVDEIIFSSEKLQEDWIKYNVKQVNGIPIKYGKDEHGNTIVQRFAFANKYSKEIQSFIQHPQLNVLKVLMPDGARIGEHEKDGAVLNHYVNVPDSNYKQLGWHTDSARDIFYGKKIEQFINIGLYLDDSSEVNGGLRVLPGTHKQGIFSMLFRKAYFLNNQNDKNEVLIRAKKGDLVIHDGRMWHRVAPSPHFGEKSRRRVIYVPLISGAYQPKHNDSKTPFYHKFQKLAG